MARKKKCNGNIGFENNKKRRHGKVPGVFAERVSCVSVIFWFSKRIEL